MGLFRDRRKAERRSGKELRQKTIPVDGQEQRVAKRRARKRRTWPFGVLYKTTAPADKVNDWLETNCKGNWAMTLDDLDDLLVEKSFKVMFEFESDKAEFIKHFSK